MSFSRLISLKIFPTLAASHPAATKLVCDKTLPQQVVNDGGQQTDLTAVGNNTQGFVERFWQSVEEVVHEIWLEKWTKK